jgi:hypothetical protein
MGRIEMHHPLHWRADGSKPQRFLAGSPSAASGHPNGRRRSSTTRLPKPVNPCQPLANPFPLAKFRLTGSNVLLRSHSPFPGNVWALRSVQ